jgi:hypothetical protein
MVAGLGGCATVVRSSSADVHLVTRPGSARCDLSGAGGWQAAVDTPAVLAIPRAAAPITVVCRAPGFRRTVASLQATAGGWIWGNSALFVATAGAAVLGAAIDESLGSNRTYDPELVVDLDPGLRRTLRARSRDDGEILDLGDR